jgi:hypothetical protein
MHTSCGELAAGQGDIMAYANGLAPLLLGALLAGGGTAAVAAPMVNLNGLDYVQYGDALTYSLPNAITDKCGGVTSGCQYYVASSPGNIQDLVVVATGSSGGPVTTNFTGMDRAYSTPNSNGIKFFRTEAGTSRGSDGAISHNGTTTWDTSLAALKSFLAGNQMVAFFNNNQVNNNGAASQSLAAWAQLSLTDASGGVIGVYDLSNMGGAYDLFTHGGGGNYMGDVGSYTSAGIGAPLAGNNAATDYVLSGGAICRNAALVPVPCSDPGASAPTNHNLGANQAAYAILFPELNAQLKDLFDDLSEPTLALYTLHLDVRLGCDPGSAAGVCDTTPYGRSLNNGFEQIFLGTAAPLPGCPSTDPGCGGEVPEPGIPALLGIGLAVLGWSRRRAQAR